MQSLPLFVVLSFVAFASAHHGGPGSVDCYCNVFATTHTSLVLLANPHSHYTECSAVDKCKQECNTKWTKQFGGGNIGRSGSGINGVSVGQQFCHTLAKQGKTDFGPYKMTSFGVFAQPSLSLLPVEVLELILAQLPYKFLITTCVCVCRQWHEVIKNPAFLPWKKLYHRYKMAPSTPSSSLLLCQGGGGGGGAGEGGGEGGGGGDDDGVLTARQVVARLSVRHGTVHDLNTCLVSIIRAVGRTHSVPQGTSHSLLQGHRLYQLARDTLNHLDAALLPPPHSLWHLAATIVTLSHDVWDIHAVILLLLRSGSFFTPCVVVEGFYSMALLLLHSTSHSIGLPLRYHYQLFYALYLYENDWGALPGGALQAKRETHAGQQSMERFVQLKSSVQYTHEQLRIISHPLQSDHVVKIVAFAGTGKTTTLLQLCKRRPDQRFLLVVYNKSVQEHCVRTFPNNTKVKTAHAMAYASVGRRFQAVHKFSMNITASSLNEFLPNRQGVGNKFRRVALAKNTLERYLNSADEHLSLQHVPTVDKLREALDDDYRLQVILPDAEAIWDEMKRCSPTQALPMTQEGQLKLWQLSRPMLAGYDVVMVDEGQDMNPAMLDVFLRQSCAKVIVGDPYQQIYSFRGAINALENVTSTHTFYLTQSFRFGPEVAYVAQCVLETLSRAEGRTLVGGHKRDCIIATGEDIAASCLARKMRTAYLGRSNFEVYETALMMAKGFKPLFP
ncbi:F-box DNA helicase 1 [Chionoecetes opilio]|uniref:F-box DNA helicase 1 n=1 Tax=Chionoecetes opilio TaxID=41210 RepID=A0A8J5CXM5_CHIOP|nr:F-box DNA helicase 1 [Chionoecetes opilio]